MVGSDGDFRRFQDPEAFYGVKSIWEQTYGMARYLMIDLFMPRADLVRQQIINKTDDIGLGLNV